MSNYLIGIDGGGTKTLGRLVLDPGEPDALTGGGGADQEILAENQVAASNPHSNPHDLVKERLHTLIETLCRTAKIDPNEVNAICLGMAGCDRPVERKLLEGFVGPLVGPNTSISVVNDAITALAGGLGKLEGIMVISGTGSIALGAKGLSQSMRAGGWGHYLDDEGSGYMLGMRALRQICRSHDEREPPTSLSDAILGHLGLTAAPDLIGWVTERAGSKAEIADLSPYVLRCAMEGDAAAIAIADHQAGELAIAAESVRRRLFGNEHEVTLVTSGGNLRNSPYYSDLFKAKLKTHSGAFKMVEPRGDAAHGALMIAAEALATGWVAGS